MRGPEELRTAAVVLAVLLTLASVHSTSAKRGCSAFGHSCFGGHGKRMDPGTVSAPEEAMYPGLRDVVFTAPRSDSLLDALRRQQQQQPDLVQEELPAVGMSQARAQEREFNLQPLLRQWLQAYRSSQEVRQNNM